MVVLPRSPYLLLALPLQNTSQKNRQAASRLKIHRTGRIHGGRGRFFRRPGGSRDECDDSQDLLGHRRPGCPPGSEEVSVSLYLGESLGSIVYSTEMFPVVHTHRPIYVYLSVCVCVQTKRHTYTRLVSGYVNAEYFEDLSQFSLDVGCIATLITISLTI